MSNVISLRRRHEGVGRRPQTTIRARERKDSRVLPIPKIALASRALVAPALSRIRSHEDREATLGTRRIKSLSDPADAEVCYRDALRS